MNFKVTLNNGSTATVGVVLKDARIVEVKEGGLSDPAMILRTSEDVVEKMATSANPALFSLMLQKWRNKDRRCGLFQLD